MFNIIKRELEFGDRKLSIEYGKIARQADSAVVVTCGETVLLCTTVYNKKASESASFFPLTVNYVEKKFAVGKIPGGFFKREGKQSEKEILTSRLIDRSIRPLFPDGFFNEVQVIATLLSYDKNCDPDTMALIGCMASVASSGLPITDIIGGLRVGLIEDKYVANPTISQLELSSLDLIFSGTRDSAFMIESSAKELSEEQMLAAIEFAQIESGKMIDVIKDFADEVKSNKDSLQFEAPDYSELMTLIRNDFYQDIVSAYRLVSKKERYSKLSEIRSLTVQKLKDESRSDSVVLSVLSSLEAEVMRGMIINDGIRIDGRSLSQIRNISAEVDVLPKSCVHGSALFTRGETQALVVTTLGGAIDEQNMECIEDDTKKDHFILQYNFPGYSVGEIAQLRGPGRREIGHGKLAYKAIKWSLPEKSAFPYTIRIVSEITESNGSSSMATVCGASLALMATGVPIKKQVAGIAMGLIKEGEKCAILSDIMGDEDHLGDMDFKVAGTRDGITALQMDIKIAGINANVMKNALEQAKQGRYHILDKMDLVLPSHALLSEFAPKIFEMQIKPEKIAEVIGKGGATIKSICEVTKAKIEIQETGLVKVFASDQAALDMAVSMIKDIVTDLVVGNIYDGTVIKLMQFGALVNISANHSGMVHISEISETRIAKVEDALQEGQQVKVLMLGFDERRRVKFSIKKAKKSDQESLPSDTKCDNSSNPEEKKLACDDKKTKCANHAKDSDTGIVDYNAFVDSDTVKDNEQVSQQTSPKPCEKPASFSDLARGIGSGK